MRKLLWVLSVAALSQAGTAWAQLVSPNEMGVAMGHVHLHVRNVETEKQFWLALGGVPGNKISVQESFRFPGILILIRPKTQSNGKAWPDADPTGGSVGSVVDHIGFKVADVKASMAKWKAAGLMTKPGDGPKQGFVFTADELKIEILEDKTLTVPIAFDHIHFLVPETSMAEIQAWYGKQFGAEPGKRGNSLVAKVPGGELIFSKSSMATVTTQGRVLDHIGFEIKDLNAFSKKLGASGVKISDPYREANGFGATRLTDPWGTYMELTEGERRY